MYLVEKVSVEALKGEWNDLIPLDALTQSLFGVTKAVVLSLEKEGMLLPRRGPGIDGYKVRLYRQEDIEQFTKALLSHAESVSPTPVNVLPLPKVSNHTGVALVEILKEVFGHRLRLLEVAGNQALFQRLVLPVAWIPEFLKAYNSGSIKNENC